jgi:hypothetical protein
MLGSCILAQIKCFRPPAVVLGLATRYGIDAKMSGN